MYVHGLIYHCICRVYFKLISKLLDRLGATDMIVSQVGFGGCVVGGEYTDKGELEEIFQVILAFCQFYY